MLKKVEAKSSIIDINSINLPEGLNLEKAKDYIADKIRYGTHEVCFGLDDNGVIRYRKLGGEDYVDVHDMPLGLHMIHNLQSVII